MKDKKGNVFNIDNLINDGAEFEQARNQNQNFAGPGVSNEAMLILNGLGNLQLSLNSIITQFSAILYAMRKSDMDLFELMQVGVKISEYVNRQYQIEQYRSSPNIDLQLLSKMDEAITKVENELLEKGIEYIEDAKSDYQRFLESQKG
jgi:flagellar biosynthesis chaperone FliJ